jgi:hypothetical protein
MPDGRAPKPAAAPAATDASFGADRACISARTDRQTADVAGAFAAAGMVVAGYRGGPFGPSRATTFAGRPGVSVGRTFGWPRRFIRPPPLPNKLRKRSRCSAGTNAASGPSPRD